MALTTDDFISMHKATEEAVTAMQMLEGDVEGYSKDILNAHFEALRQTVLTLAVVQRDLLKAMLT